MNATLRKFRFIKKKIPPNYNTDKKEYTHHNPKRGSKIKGKQKCQKGQKSA